MSVLSLALFGSHARGDGDASSDVDILAIEDLGTLKTKSEGSANFAFYPFDFLLNLSRNGDLFMLHIVSESKVIYDPLGLLSRISNEFKYRDSYLDDISKASEIGWLLIDKATVIPANILNRRIAWCVRTILIAQAAELRMPIFSASGLANFSKWPDAMTLIKSKGSSDFSGANIWIFERFIERFGDSKPDWHQSVSLEERLRLFRNARNSLGVKTIRELLGSTTKTSMDNYVPLVE